MGVRTCASLTYRGLFCQRVDTNKKEKKMRYVADSDRAMAQDRRRRRDEARAKAYKEAKDKAEKLGYGLVKLCPQCKRIGP